MYVCLYFTADKRTGWWVCTVHSQTQTYRANTVSKEYRFIHSSTPMLISPRCLPARLGDKTASSPVSKCDRSLPVSETQAPHVAISDRGTRQHYNTQVKQAGGGRLQFRRVNRHHMMNTCRTTEGWSSCTPALQIFQLYSTPHSPSLGV